MSKFFRIFTSNGVKCNFFIKVHSVELPNMEGVNEKDRFAVCFERGNRINISSDQPPLFEYTGDVGIDFDETLALDCTLYMNADGKYESKEGIVSLLQRRKGALGLKKGKEGFKSVGTCKLQLHSNLSDGAAHEVEMPLQWCIAEGATIKMTITATYLNGKPPIGMKSQASQSNQKVKSTTESGYNAADLEDMFTLPTSKPKKAEEYAPWGDDDEEIAASPWDSDNISPDWSKTHSDSLAAELTGLGDLNENDDFAPSPSFSAPADNAFENFAPSSGSSLSPFAEESFEKPASATGAFDAFAPSAPTPATQQWEPEPEPEPKPKQVAEAKHEVKEDTKTTQATAAFAGLKEIFVTSYATHASEPMVRFKLVLPRDVKVGDEIKKIGGNRKINAVVPAGCKGGDHVVLVLPESCMTSDDDDEEDEVPQPKSTEPLPPKITKYAAPSSSSNAVPLSSSSTSAAAAATASTSAGSDEITRLQSALTKAEKALAEETEIFGLYKENADREIQKLKAKQAATESMVNMASSKMSSSNMDSQVDKAEISKLTAEIAGLRERNAMLEALSAKASFYSSKVEESESVIAAMKEQSDKQMEDILGLEARARDLEIECSSLHQQVLDSKLTLVQLSVEADEAKKSAGILKARAQVLAAKVASMEVAVVEAELLKAELMANGSSSTGSSGTAKPPSMPSFLQKKPVASTVNPTAPTQPVPAEKPPQAPVAALRAPSPLPSIPAPVSKPPPRPNFAVPAAAAAAPGKFPVPETEVASKPSILVSSNTDNISHIEAKVRRFYQQHNPARINDIPSIMAKWAGKEKLLIASLEEKYGGKSDEGDSDLC